MRKIGCEMNKADIETLSGILYSFGVLNLHVIEFTDETGKGEMLRLEMYLYDECSDEVISALTRFLRETGADAVLEIMDVKEFIRLKGEGDITLEDAGGGRRKKCSRSLKRF